DNRSMSWGSNDTSTPPSIFVTLAADSFECAPPTSFPVVPPDMSLPWGLSVNYYSAPSSELASPTNLQLRPPSPAASLASYASDDGLSFGFLSDAELEVLSGLRPLSSPALAGPALLTTPAAMQPRATLLAASAPSVHDAPPRRSSETLVSPASGCLNIPGLGQDALGRRLVPRSASDSAHFMTTKPAQAAAPAAANDLLAPVPLVPSLVGNDHRFAATASLGPGFTVTASDDPRNRLLVPGRCLTPAPFPAYLHTYDAAADAAAACPSLSALSESSVAQDDSLADLLALAPPAAATVLGSGARAVTSCNVMLAQMEYDIR
ncbi:hypothetical protein HK405_009621, partial [Cladochytrium tenue]